MDPIYIGQRSCLTAWALDTDQSTTFNHDMCIYSHGCYGSLGPYILPFIHWDDLYIRDSVHHDGGRKPLCSKYWYKLSNDGFFPSAQIAMCSSSHPDPL